MTKSDDKQNLDLTGVVATPGHPTQASIQEKLGQEKLGQEKPGQEKSGREEPEMGTRREFLGKTLAAASGVALSGLLPSATEEAVAQTPCPPTGIASQPLLQVGQITRQGGKLQAIIRVRNEERA